MTEATVIKTGKWTEDEANKAAELYAEFGSTPDAVERAAEQLNRSKKSVQGKLSHMGVYVVPEKKPAAKKDEGPTKGEILTAIANAGFDADGFEAANKDALKRLHTLVVEKYGDTTSD